MVTTTSRILGPDGQPIQLKQLASEPQTARLAGLHSEYQDHPTRGLTPARLARLYEDAEQGDLTAQGRLAEDMEEKDAHLFAELSKRRQALLTVDWMLVPPADASASEKADCAALESIMRDELDLDQLIIDLAEGILPGYSCIELEWAQSEGQWRFEPHSRPADWFTVQAEDRNTLRLRNNQPGGEALRPWGWIVHKHPAKSGYLTRAGLVRVLGWPFLFRNLTARDLAEFLEIYGLPLRLGRYPNGATPEEKSTLMQAVVNIGHAAAGILPEGMSVEFQQAATGAADPFMAMMQWAEQSISKAILGGTLTSQVDGKGSYAAAQTHNEVRGDILRADLRLIARTLTRDLVTPLARLNTRLQRLPSVRFDTAEAEDMTAIANALPNLVDAGVRIPARWVHDKLRIPEPEGDEPVLARPTAQPATPNVADATRRAAPHVTGCQCDGCLGLAALKATPPSDDLQDQLDRLDPPNQHDQAQAMIRPLLDAMREGMSPEQAMDAVAEAYPAMDADLLTEALARAMFAAELAGRLEVQGEK
ncbi:MAG: DUF935 domain-containing protein [Pseudomonadota bacterium]